MTNLKFFTRNELLIFLALLGFSSCGVTGSSGALPQAVIPNELITVSSPDADGNVTVTGAATSVGASSIVIAQVSAGTARNSAQHLSLPDWLMAPAYATTCTSDLPTCPTLDDDGKCQDTSDSTGAFVLTVPATTTSTLTISYIDTTSCTETSTFESGIPDSSTIVALSLDVMSLAADDNLSSVYLFGQDADLSNTVHRLNLETHEETAFDISITGTPHESMVVSSIDGTTRLIMTSDAEAMAKTIDDSTGLSSSGNALVSESGAAITNLSPVGYHDFTAPDNLSSTCSSNSSATGDDYTRVFFYTDTEMYYANDLNPLYNNYSIDSETGTELFSINFTISSGGTILNIERIEYAYIMEIGTGYAIFLVITPVEGDASYAFVVSESDIQGCGGTTQLNTDDDGVLSLSRPGESGLKGAQFSSSASNEDHFSLFDIDGQIITIVSASSTAASLVEQVDFTTNVDVGFTISSAKVLYNFVLDQYEYLLIGADTAGSVFYTGSGDSRFDSGGNVVAIDAKLIYIDPLDETLASIFDKGNSGDGLSNMILLDINVL